MITVDGSGWFAANVPAHDAIAIHIGAPRLTHCKEGPLLIAFCIRRGPS